MSDDTVLRLSGIGIAPYSERGLSETIEPIAEAAQLARTVNGELDDISEPGFRKYMVTISGADDINPPALDAVWPGHAVTVDCISELAYATSTAGPARTVVEGSEREELGFTFYRPRLSCRVVSFSIARNEWGEAVGWTLRLEEI
jgi:hypothetical protein